MEAELYDGTILEFPDDTPPDVIGKVVRRETQARRKNERMAALPQSMANIEADQASYNPAKDMSASDLRVAGVGKAFVDLGRGVSQVAAAAGDAFGIRGGRVEAGRQAVADSRQLDAPLMDTTAGKVGNLAGNIATLGPTVMIPGANTVAGAGVIGAASGLLQPSTSTQETLKNTALGGVLGAGGQKAGQVIGNKAGQVIANRRTAAATAQSENSVRDATLQAARQAGYVVPPSTPNPSVTNRVIESVSGKAQTQQAAMVKNQQVTNRLVREELGLQKGTPLTVNTLEGLRRRAGNVYGAIKASGEIVTDQQYLDELTNLSRSADEVLADFPDLNFAGSEEVRKLQDGLLRDKFTANGAIEAMKKLRAEASKNLAWNVEDPSKKALGLAQREAAGILEEQVVRHLQATGRGQLATQFDNARKLIAKTYSVQAALNEGSGNVVATKLSAQLRKGKPLSGKLELAANFGAAFPKAAGEQTASAGVSAVDAITAGVLGTTLDPMLLGLPVARIGARSLALSGPYQRGMAQPTYGSASPLLQLMQRTAPLSAPIAVGVGNSK